MESCGFQVCQKYKHKKKKTKNQKRPVEGGEQSTRWLGVFVMRLSHPPPLCGSVEGWLVGWHRPSGSPMAIKSNIHQHDFFFFKKKGAKQAPRHHLAGGQT